MAYERAVQWTLAHSDRLWGHPLLYVPGKRNFQDEPVLVGMSKRVAVAMWKTLSSAHWGGGPVLAAWPTEKHLADIDGDRRTTWPGPLQTGQPGTATSPATRC